MLNKATKLMDQRNNMIKEAYQVLNVLGVDVTQQVINQIIINKGKIVKVEVTNEDEIIKLENEITFKDGQIFGLNNRIKQLEEEIEALKAQMITTKVEEVMDVKAPEIIIDEPEEFTYDENDEVYQFDIDYDENIVFNQINDHANIINKVRSSDNANVVYEFNVVDGVAQINIITTDLVNAGANSRGIVAYGGLDIIDLGEVFLRCAQHVKVRITDEIYLGRDLILMIKKNFKIESLEVQESKDVLDGITFKTASKNDRRYFRVYRNGRLVPRHVGAIRFPIDYDYSEMEVYPGFKRELDDEIMVECMPYMMTQTCYMERIPKDKVVDLTGMIDKPFDFKWYDIYLNGRKLIKKDVEIISANKIKIMNAKSVRWLEIIENSRDKEYFGYKPVYDILDLLFDTNQEFADNVNNTIHIDDLEEPVVEDIISLLDYILREFYNWLKDNFGLINPDLLQISRYNIVAFKELLSEDEPFELNPDKYGKDGCDLYLTVNPDDEE